MSALIDYLDEAHHRVAPTERFAGLVQHGSGVPDDNTSPFYLFYVDDDADAVYINPERTSGSWVQIEGADVISPSGSGVTADV